MTREERYRLWLNFAVKADYNAQNKLLRLFGCAEDIFRSSSDADIERAAGQKFAKKIKESANEAYIDKCMEYLHKQKIKTVTLGSENYPYLLANIDDPPFVLYYKGELKADVPLPIAVIGSRKHSLYAQSVAESLSRQLCENGACIISGMAMGIDSFASKAALSVNCDYPTVVVLGGGVDNIYPRSNEKLYHEIVERGAVISEWLPATKPEKWHFPYRNRIISGLSKGVLVIEAREKSGTSITVSRALEQGRDVFAVPGRINEVLCKGSNSMIREGCAKAVFDVNDILCEYGITNAVIKNQRISIHENEHSIEELLILKILQVSQRSFDELAVMTKYEPLKLNSVLTDLEFSGIIKQLPGRIYEIMPEIDIIEDERQW